MAYLKQPGAEGQPRWGPRLTGSGVHCYEYDGVPKEQQLSIPPTEDQQAKFYRWALLPLRPACQRAGVAPECMARSTPGSWGAALPTTTTTTTAASCWHALWQPPAAQHTAC